MVEAARLVVLVTVATEPEICVETTYTDVSIARQPYFPHEHTVTVPPVNVAVTICVLTGKVLVTVDAACETVIVDAARLVVLVTVATDPEI